jgi:tripartite-type tricarboxylate transporter receptor subunit TctC
MRDIKLIAGLSNLVLLALFLFRTPLYAQESFYRGKTLRFIVACEPGGGFDVYTRTIARHFGKHVPGIPPLSWRI